ncbi:hypothetical protein [Catenulispora subtropica]
MVVITSAAHAANALLAEGAGGKEHSGINPPLNGAIVLGILLVLLFITTRLNKDR